MGPTQLHRNGGEMHCHSGKAKSRKQNNFLIFIYILNFDATLFGMLGKTNKNLHHKINEWQKNHEKQQQKGRW